MATPGPPAPAPPAPAPPAPAPPAPAPPTPGPPTPTKKDHKFRWVLYAKKIRNKPYI